MSQTKRVADVFHNIVEDHEKLVLEYHEAESNFRDCFSSKISMEETRLKSKARKLAFEKLTEYEREIGKEVIEKAYKKTRRLNLLENPKLSPYYVKLMAEKRADYESAKDLMQEHFQSLQGQTCRLKVDSSNSPLWVELQIVYSDEPLFRFLAAAVFDSKNKPSLLFFNLWSLSSNLLQKIAPQWLEAANRRFAVPLALQPAGEVTGRVFLDWVMELCFKTLSVEIENDGDVEELKTEFLTTLAQLKPDLDLLRQQFPEVFPIITKEEK